MATKRISDLQLRSNFDDTVNLPGDDSSQTWRVTGSQIKAYIQAQIADLMKSASDRLNLGLAASVSGNALTIALKQIDGSTDPTAASPVKIGFRGTTAGNGDASLVSAVAATSLVISSGSTLGMSNGVAATIYVYALNNGGTIELAASRKLFDEGSLQSTTAEGGAGASDSATVLYSTTARTSKAIRLIGKMVASEATAGTWASAPSEISVQNYEKNIREILASDGTEDPMAGRIGEYMESLTAAGTSFPTTANWGDAGSLALTAGEWELTMISAAVPGPATTFGYHNVGISTTTGNSSTGLVQGSNMSGTLANVVTNSSMIGANIPGYRVKVASTTTYYGKVQAGYTGSAPTYGARLSARRVG